MTWWITCKWCPSPRSWHMRGATAGTGGVSQVWGQPVQSSPLCCVRTFCLSIHCQNAIIILMILMLIRRLLFCFFVSLSSSIHDNEGAAEMLIDTIGPKIVNSTDAKKRYTDKRLALASQCCAKAVFYFSIHWHWHTVANDCGTAGRRCTRQPSRTTWSVSSCCWATMRRSTVWMPRGEPPSWWPLRMARQTQSVWPLLQTTHLQSSKS